MVVAPPLVLVTGPVVGSVVAPDVVLVVRAASAVLTDTGVLDGLAPGSVAAGAPLVVVTGALVVVTGALVVVTAPAVVVTGELVVVPTTVVVVAPPAPPAPPVPPVPLSPAPPATVTASASDADSV